MTMKKAAGMVLAARGGRHCIGAILPQMCFSCPLADCDCSAPITREEKQWNDAGSLPKTRKKPKAQVESRTVTVVDNYTTPRPAKSARRYTNYEYLLY